MEIKISELELVTEKLFSHLRELSIENVHLSEDYYWDISKEQLYDPVREPSTFSLGQLSEDWNELVELIHGHGEPLAYDLTRLAAILRAVGQNVLG